MDINRDSLLLCLMQLAMSILLFTQKTRKPVKKEQMCLVSTRIKRGGIYITLFQMGSMLTLVKC